MQFKDKILQPTPLHGIIVTMSLPSAIEALSECGLDWLWIDMEHAPLSLMDVQQMLQAKSKACAALVRIPKNTDEWIQRVLDLGVEGIIVPHVNNQAEAERAIASSLYPPDGTRSVGSARANRYGMDPSYKKEANSKRLVFMQIEHREAVKNIEAIVQVPGLDGIIVGPYDLSGSFDKLGQIEDPEVLEAIEQVVTTCKRFKKPIGIFAKYILDAKRYLEQGFQLVATGIDMNYLWGSVKETVDQLKNSPR